MKPLMFDFFKEDPALIDEAVDKLPTVLLRIVFDYAQQDHSPARYQFVQMEVSPQSNALVRLRDDKTTAEDRNTILKDIFATQCYQVIGVTQDQIRDGYVWSDEQFEKERRSMLRRGRDFPDHRALALVKIAPTIAQGSTPESKKKDEGTVKAISNIFVLGKNNWICFDCNGMNMQFYVTNCARTNPVFAGTGKYSLPHTHNSCIII